MNTRILIDGSNNKDDDTNPCSVIDLSLLLGEANNGTDSFRGVNLV